LEPASKVAYYAGAALALQKLGLDAEAFVEAVDEEDPELQEQQLAEEGPSSEADEPKSPRWGNSSSLEAGDNATRNHEMGVPAFGGV
jgi:hypothetical protein